jgi:undecaprenyl-diphosphatase
LFIYYFNAFVKGVIEGVTEFLPISSTGHLIVARQWFPLTPDANPEHIKKLENIFDVIIQLPAVLAVLLLYRQRLFGSLKAISTDTRSRNFWLGLVIAFLPAGLFGFLFHHRIEDQLMSEIPVAIALIVGGIILILVERGPDTGKYAEAEDVPLATCFFIGVFQCFGMIPGTSRSGATIVGGRLMHLTRSAAAEYSFFLAIPTMFGAFAFKMFKGWKDIDADSVPVLVIGSVTSFVVAWIVVKWLIGYVRKHSLAAFGYYRIALGILILLYTYYIARK